MSTNKADTVVRSTAWKIPKASINNESLFSPSPSPLSVLADPTSPPITQALCSLKQSSPNISLSSNVSNCEGLEAPSISPVTLAETTLRVDSSRAVTQAGSSMAVSQVRNSKSLTQVETSRAATQVESSRAVILSGSSRAVTLSGSCMFVTHVEGSRAVTQAGSSTGVTRVESSLAINQVERSLAINQVESSPAINQVESSLVVTNTAESTHTTLLGGSSVISFTPRQILPIATKSKPICDQPSGGQRSGSSSYPGHSQDQQNNKEGVTREFVCEDCGKAFVKAYRLKEHTMMHNPRPCKYCEKVFRSYSGLRDHISAIHDSNRYICLTCNKLFKTVKSLKAHRVSNVCDRELNTKTIKCTKCEKKFKNKKCLNVHMKKKHPEED